MKNHKGMRPHDIVVLLKIAALGENPWMMKDLANELYISSGEVSESLNRSAYAGLISANKRQLMIMALLEFLQYGLKYVYPQQPGALVRGMPTAWAAPPLSEHIVSEENVVWPYAEGTVRGQAVEPLYSGIPRACVLDTKLYELLALTDALRIGKARERNIAVEELTKRLVN
jgi:predicted transcriptional regulator